MYFVSRLQLLVSCRYVRVVKETDSKSVGLCLRRFESCCRRFSFCEAAIISIAQNLKPPFRLYPFSFAHFYALAEAKTSSIFMASSLRLNPVSLPSLYPIPTQRSLKPVRCGPRDNRGPLVKGRILSTEAIQAIQSLKRAYRSSSSSTATNTQLPSLSRLIKTDLLAALRELLRQDQCTLALHVLSTVQAEYPPPDLALYADVIVALTRNRMMDEIDRLVEEMDEIDCDDERALVRLIKGVITAERRESTVRICGLMKENGVGSKKRVGEYVVKVLSRGLRRFGEVDLALEVEREFGELPGVNMGKVRV